MEWNTCATVPGDEGGTLGGQANAPDVTWTQASIWRKGKVIMYISFATNFFSVTQNYFYEKCNKYETTLWSELIVI